MPFRLVVWPIFLRTTNFTIFPSFCNFRSFRSFRNFRSIQLRPLDLLFVPFFPVFIITPGQQEAESGTLGITFEWISWGSSNFAKTTDIWIPINRMIFVFSILTVFGGGMLMFRNLFRNNKIEFNNSQRMEISLLRNTNMAAALLYIRPIQLPQDTRNHIIICKSFPWTLTDFTEYEWKRIEKQIYSFLKSTNLISQILY